MISSKYSHFVGNNTSIEKSYYENWVWKKSYIYIVTNNLCEIVLFISNIILKLKFIE